MNNEILEIVKSLRSDILSLELFNEYVSLKKEINNSKTLQKSIKNLKYLKKCDCTDFEKEEYNQVKNKIESDPLIHNFMIVQDEINDLFKEIRDILSI